jgi:hypothetical protein
MHRVTRCALSMCPHSLEVNGSMCVLLLEIQHHTLIVRAHNTTVSCVYLRGNLPIGVMCIMVACCFTAT